MVSCFCLWQGAACGCGSSLTLPGHDVQSETQERKKEIFGI